MLDLPTATSAIDVIAPATASLLGVVVGGFLTYMTQNKLEERRRPRGARRLVRGIGASATPRGHCFQTAWDRLLEVTDRFEAGQSARLSEQEKFLDDLQVAAEEVETETSRVLNDMGPLFAIGSQRNQTQGPDG